MTFAEIKAMAADNGTASGILVKSIVETMLERGDDDSRLNNIYDKASQQGTQSGVLLNELLDVMYDLGYDEDTLDVLWENCEQQGTQSSAYVKETADIAAKPPYTPPTKIGEASTMFDGSYTVNRIPVYDLGSLHKDSGFTMEWLRKVFEAVPAATTLSQSNLQNNHRVPRRTSNTIEGSTVYEYSGDTRWVSGGKVFAFLTKGDHTYVFVIANTDFSKADVVLTTKDDMLNINISGNTNRVAGVTYIDMQ